MSNNNNRNSITDKSLIILQFNSNGLKNHIHELKTVLINKLNNVALRTETHFTKYSGFYIPGYILIKTNHPDNTTHGGVAIFVKFSIAFQSLPPFCQDYIQSSSIKLKLNNLIFTIAVMYASPKHNITNLQFSEYFNTIKGNFIICGNYNAKHQSWGYHANNPRGFFST